MQVSISQTRNEALGNDGSEQAVGRRGRGTQMEAEKAGRDPVVIICGCPPQEFCYFFSLGQ